VEGGGLAFFVAVSLSGVLLGSTAGALRVWEALTEDHRSSPGLVALAHAAGGLVAGWLLAPVLGAVALYSGMGAPPGRGMAAAAMEAALLLALAGAVLGALAGLIGLREARPRGVPAGLWHVGRWAARGALAVPVHGALTLVLVLWLLRW
jgi:hypothetical protein